MTRDQYATKTAQFAMVAIASVLWMSAAWGADRHPLSGLVLKVDREHRSLVVSCEAAPGYMDAMTMTISVRDVKVLDNLQSGSVIGFTVGNGAQASYAEDIHIQRFESVEQEPQEAQRLKLLQDLANPPEAITPLRLGNAVPNFIFSDQNAQPLSLAQLNGDVVVLTFIYTRCPNPNYCFRLNSNLARLQKRFPDRMGRGLVLLSLVVDPEHDQGDTLRNYANIWKADAKGWHFLTGQLQEIQKITRLFGMDFWSGEGAVTHTFHTIVVDPQQRLAANLEGNQFTAKQLGDLVETLLPAVTR